MGVVGCSGVVCAMCMGATNTRWYCTTTTHCSAQPRARVGGAPDAGVSSLAVSCMATTTSASDPGRTRPVYV